MIRLFQVCIPLLAALMSSLLCSCSSEEDPNTVNIGHFPNVTHIQALVARNMSRRGEGWFERYLPEHRIQWHLYTAGPTAMEALFSRTLDLCYVGPSPAINAFAASQGREVLVHAGAVDGGAALLTGANSQIASAGDFKGKRVATPQLGNTQDVACRAWMSEHGITNTLNGKGDVLILPTSNSMQLVLMERGEIDASWTVEPWVSQLQQSAGAQIFQEQRDAVTTILTARKAWFERDPALAKTMLRAHDQLTTWIILHPEEAQQRVIDELSILMKAPIDPAIIKSAWARLTPTTTINLKALEGFLRDAQAAQILKESPPISEIIAPCSQNYPYPTFSLSHARPTRTRN